MDQFVYVVGGYDGTDQLSSVERYDVETNQWQILATMSRPRSALSLAVVSNRLYALGRTSFSSLVVQEHR